MRILLIEDEIAMATAIKRGLEEEHFSVEVAHNGREGYEKASDSRFALIVLDLMLPGMDGWTICERLREQRDPTPILMLTARDSLEDRVHGLEMGADDYLPKPFGFTEFLARVHALLRRDRLHKTRVIRIDDLEIDTRARLVTRAGQAIVLTDREFTLLEALASREGQVLSRDAIIERIWMDDASYSNTVDVHIGALRKKIDAGHTHKLIHTIRGTGYTLRRDDET